MKHKQRISGGITAFIGYLLSPLSWWNDVYLNIPLSYLGAWLASFFYKPAFLTAFVVSYWITNVAGLVLMHKGITKVAGREIITKGYSKKDLLKDIVLALLYTGAIIIMVKLHIIRPLEEYFTGTNM